MDITGIGSVADLVRDGLDKLFPDPSARAAAELKVQELDNQLLQGQMAINEAEASNSSVFVSGWRPFLGWICGFAFAYHMIIVPLVQFILASRGVTYIMPVFDDSMLSTTLMGMLGLGVMRTTEKMGDKGHLPWQK